MTRGSASMICPGRNVSCPLARTAKVVGGAWSKARTTGRMETLCRAAVRQMALDSMMSLEYGGE
eukprot:CAMPEP_0195031872 /NCGR_PEP_ID=MMETSP0326_2-20130528/62255_1 /TAXON_ID=2866 ORGANISM="Crypthecodinium cohnii, Strain Seligo" /NCGR_SAMPLE_ID=MMETSP0326_2 /ASSEMBLY_ACC=CAM_ASM_000348 /LENGTH=63 /DNA_ID=CAMNT_0040055769 /DNA_START=130 /DNA_END=321 /DNA_ORIENTATION=-